jgi:hypothetical protein
MSAIPPEQQPDPNGPIETPAEPGEEPNDDNGFWVVRGENHVAELAYLSLGSATQRPALRISISLPCARGGPMVFG